MSKPEGESVTPFSVTFDQDWQELTAEMRSLAKALRPRRIRQLVTLRAFGASKRSR